MKLKQLLLLIIIISFNCTFLKAQIAPDIQWSKTVGLGRLYMLDCAYSARQTMDGGYIITGFVGVDFSSSRNCWIIKIDSTGNIEWQRELGGSENDEAYSVEQTADGGFIIAGVTNSKDGDLAGVNNRTYDYWIIKLTGTGSIEWQKALGGSNADYAREIKQTNDGGYIVAGWSASTDGDVTGNHGGGDYWVVKLSSTGNIEWQKCLGGSRDDWGTAVQQTIDGGYIVAGYTESNDGDINFNHGDMDYWIVKLNSVGSIEWQKTFGGSGYERPWSIQQTSNKGFIVAGESKSHDGDVTINHGDFDWWVIKLDKQGNMEWQKTLGGSLEDDVHSVIETRDSMYVIAGGTYSNDFDVSSNKGYDDYWIVALNQQGEIEWEKCYGGSNGGETAYSISQTKDGGFIAAGMGSSTNGDVNLSDWRLWPEYWIVKLTPSKNSFNLFGFTVKKNCRLAELDWQTSSEVGTALFEVQRSSNGSDFDSIGAEKAAGNSTTIKTYHFTDQAPVDGLNYYRLKLVSINGKYKYSAVKKVLINQKGRSLFSPNPVNTFITIIPTCNLKQIEVIASDGKLIRRMQPAADDRYNISDLPAAVYFFKLQYENNVELLRIVKL